MLHQSGSICSALAFCSRTWQGHGAGVKVATLAADVLNLGLGGLLGSGGLDASLPQSGGRAGLLDNGGSAGVLEDLSGCT